MLVHYPSDFLSQLSVKTDLFHGSQLLSRGQTVVFPLTGGCGPPGPGPPHPALPG